MDAKVVIIGVLAVPAVVFLALRTALFVCGHPFWPWNEPDDGDG